MNGWLTLIRERFPLAAYLPMVALFVAANGAASVRATGGEPAYWRYAVAAAVAMLYFFRLRCFDEIKDYDTDVEINPDRPLPRGVLAVPQVFRGILVVGAVELAVVSSLGLAAAGTHAIAMLYSFLMYREFFIGKWLRPHLTTYAVTHTFSSILLGYSLCAQITGVPLWQFSTELLLFGVLNWMLFNLFEFARKTYAPAEERAGVDTYSSLFGPLGAALLSLSQIAVALAIIHHLLGTSALWQHAIAAAVFAAVALAYVARHHLAGAVRVTSGVYIIAFYGLLTYQLWI